MALQDRKRTRPEPTLLLKGGQVLTPDTEAVLQKTVAELGSNDANARQNAEAALARYGRLREPVLRRVLALTHAADIRAQAEAQIAKGTAPK